MGGQGNRNSDTKGTHRGWDVDEEGVAVDTHSLQEGVAAHLPFSPLPPGQETPQSDRHQPGIQEDDHRCCRHCGRGQNRIMTCIVSAHNRWECSRHWTDLYGTVACSGTRGCPVGWGRWTNCHWLLPTTPGSHRSRKGLKHTNVQHHWLLLSLPRYNHETVIRCYHANNESSAFSLLHSKYHFFIDQLIISHLLQYIGSFLELGLVFFFTIALRV